MNRKKILIIVGSMRKKSFNRQLAEAAKAFLQEKADVDILEYADLPYMNQDIEFPVPEPVARIRRQAEAADGIWIFSPEYNHSIPGVLKNLLDWLSRPQEGQKGPAAAGKPVTFAGAAGASGSACMQDDLLFLLNYMGMKVAPGARLTISLTPDEFQTSRLNLSERSHGYLENQAAGFLKFLEIS